MVPSGNLKWVKIQWQFIPRRDTSIPASGNTYKRMQCHTDLRYSAGPCRLNFTYWNLTIKLKNPVLHLCCRIEMIINIHKYSLNIKWSMNQCFRADSFLAIPCSHIFLHRCVFHCLHKWRVEGVSVHRRLIDGQPIRGERTVPILLSRKLTYHGNRKIIFKSALGWDMLVPRKVYTQYFW